MRGTQNKQTVRFFDIRWLSHGNALDVVEDQWDELGTYFKAEARGNGPDVHAISILCGLYVPKNKVVLIFVADHIRRLNKLNKAFQAEGPSQARLLDHLLSYYYSMLDMVISSDGVNRVKASPDPISFDFAPHLKDVKAVHFGHKFEVESVTAFQKPDDLAHAKLCLYNFLVEICLQIRARLPDNLKILKRITSMEPQQIFSNSDPRDIGVLASHYSTLGGIGVDISAAESELRQLRHALNATVTTPLLEFWSSVASASLSGDKLYPQLTRLASALLCLPISNATVERVFSVMVIIKNKLRNRLAIPMVEAVLTVRYNLRRRGETCETFTVLPEMMQLFNYNMYDHIKAHAIIGTRATESAQEETREELEEEDELVQLLDEVERVCGEPVFLTLE